jgi:hypothetical protein
MPTVLLFAHELLNLVHQRPCIKLVTMRAKKCKYKFHYVNYVIHIFIQNTITEM